MLHCKAPARICFFGDHQDYLALPVIAGAIDRYFHIKGKGNTLGVFRIEFKDLGKRRTIDPSSDESVESGDFLRAALVVLAEKGCVFNTGYDLVFHSTIPINAGLSSSSAMIVAWIRFLVAIQEEALVLSDAEIGRLAYATEVGFFEGPGGLMDQFSIAQKGLRFIDTESGDTKRLTADLGVLIVAESGMAKKTLKVLQKAREYAEKAVAQVKAKHPDFQLKHSEESDFDRYLPHVSKEYHDYWYAAIHNLNITRKACEQLQGPTPDIVRLGRLMIAHQTILEQRIKNTPAAMSSMMRAAIDAGAVGSKIIGSGGGGCMLALTSPSLKTGVIDAFLAHGAASAYEVNLSD
ncbi:GHMP kinase [Flagellimonas sp. DF-77]|uniref:GHMP family kinase ATP-binding protein n=1 Tax=Flagellimonas algarum TaxID=3230298 RepID=UPI003395CDDC